MDLNAYEHLIRTESAARKFMLGFAGKTNKDFVLNVDKENFTSLLTVDVDVPVAVIPSTTSPEGGLIWLTLTADSGFG